MTLPKASSTSPAENYQSNVESSKISLYVWNVIKRTSPRARLGLLLPLVVRPVDSLLVRRAAKLKATMAPLTTMLAFSATWQILIVASQRILWWINVVALTTTAIRAKALFQCFYIFGMCIYNLFLYLQKFRINSFARTSLTWTVSCVRFYY